MVSVEPPTVVLGGALSSLWERGWAVEQWNSLLQPFVTESCPLRALHMGVFAEPYLSYLFEGTKTVESRFSKTFRAPHGRVAAGDIILLKRTAGDVEGLCTVTDTWTYQLRPGALDELRRRFGDAVAAGDDFWEQKAEASYATLMAISDVRHLPPLRVDKRDRHGWVVLRDRAKPTLF